MQALRGIHRTGQHRERASAAPPRTPLFGQLRRAMHLGVGNAFIEQPRIQLVVVLEPQPRCEESLTDKPDLVLDLSLLPARRRRAGARVNEAMAAHLQESAIVETLLADEDGRYRRLHVVVDGRWHVPGRMPDRKRRTPSPASRADRPHEQHAVMAEPEMCHLHVTVTPLSKTTSWLQSN
jgi:hypothetical protein